LAALCLAGLATGCSDGGFTEPLDGAIDAAVAEVALTTIADEREDAIEALSRSVALALAEPEARTAIIREMRGSPFHEHKLLLGSFLESDVGGALLDAAHGRGGASRQDLAELVARFPGDLDFYVASKDQRRSWAGSQRLLVAGVTSDDATEARAFDPDGNSLVISSLDVPGYDVIFSIHPAEPKISVDRPQAGGTETIEVSSSVQMITGTANAVCEVEVCDGGGGGGGGGSGGGGSTSTFTRVNRIQPNFYDCFLCGDLELYFRVENVNVAHDTSTTPIFSAVPHENNIVNVHLHDESANSGVSPLVLQAHLWESDNEFPGGGDDPKGESLPDIGGSGSYISWDPFIQDSWGGYNVIVGCVGETWCE